MLLYMDYALPLDRLIETDTLLAFFHPHPAYPFHVLIVPRQAIHDMMTLTPDNSAFLMDVINAAQQIVKDYHLGQSGYRLILNGGPNQDFPLLHFHLIAEKNPKTTKEHE